MSGVSIILPALNEESGLKPSVRLIEDLLTQRHLDYEILLIDDGSSDDTRRVARELADANRRIRLILHSAPRGLGYSYKEGLASASKPYVILLTANNECDSRSIGRILDMAGRADMIIPYTENQHERPRIRRWLSRVFVMLLNAISGLRLKYYNGTVLHRTALVRSVPITTDGYGYQAEALIRLIRSGRSYKEVGIRVRFRKRKTKAFRVKNMFGILAFLWRLVSRPPKRSPHERPGSGGSFMA